MPSGDPVRIAVFASGAGSNALKIIEHFDGNPQIRISAVICNNPIAGVLGHASQNHIPALLVTRRLMQQRDWFLRQLEALETDVIVLAGFLLLIPEYLVSAYPQRIINIHPALLPAYGGKGMYGMHVHNAVKAAGETQTGITIHLVNTEYDDGEILFQTTTAIAPEDTPDDIAMKVHRLEHQYYPQVIQDYISGQFRLALN